MHIPRPSKRWRRPPSVLELDGNAPVTAPSDKHLQQALVALVERADKILLLIVSGRGCMRVSHTVSAGHYTLEFTRGKALPNRPAECYRACGEDWDLARTKTVLVSFRDGEESWSRMHRWTPVRVSCLMVPICHGVPTLETSVSQVGHEQASSFGITSHALDGTAPV